MNTNKLSFTKLDPDIASPRIMRVVNDGVLILGTLHTEGVEYYYKASTS